METKICRKCNLVQNVCEFKIYNKKTGARINECCNCKIQYLKQYNEETKNLRLKQKKEYRERNKGILSEKKQKYYLENKEKIKVYKKEWETQKRKNDIIFKLKQISRHRIYMYLKRKNLTKKNKTFDLVGCTPEFLKEHLQSQFKDGMGWDNYGSWHIDHIIPLSVAKDEKEIYRLCHYTNLQPLWATENLSKGRKINSV
jgi:hypothetical protein